MREIPATFYDGKTSHKKEVRLYFEGSGRMRVVGLGTELVFPQSAIRITDRLANTPRSLYFPDGGKCETLENDAIDEILRGQGKSRWQLILHTLESRLGYALLALVVTVVGGWGLVEYGIPFLATRVAYAVPASVNAALGREGLKVLDQVLFSPSALDEQQQTQLRLQFADMTQDITERPHLRLEFRKSERVGPNAIALPSGMIVLTDELVSLVEHPNEIISVLAHEVGHIRHRHALRGVLQNSAVVLIIASVTGDVTSITALSATLPTILLEAQYSRAFETEADQFALQYLQEHNIPLTHFADILMRMESVRGNQGQVPNYLATHPATKKRVEMFKIQDATDSEK